MRRFLTTTLLIPVLLAGGPTSASTPTPETPTASGVPRLAPFPYAAAGLTPREAAAHLLNRFTFGPRPGQIDAVLAEGMENWLDRQLAASDPEEPLGRRLESFRTLGLSATELAETYANAGVILRRAQEAGRIKDPRVRRKRNGKEVELSAKQRRQQLMSFAREQGYRPMLELIRELTGQKLLRAVYAENQVEEVLVDFWTNHFAISLTDPETRSHSLSYERDAIRPRALSSFRELLGASAKHPAMLIYLDNARSSAEPGRKTTIEAKLRAQRRQGRRFRIDPEDASLVRRGRQARNMGLNENYARELLELHTLGVDGGYTQDDVVEVARAMTGWTTLPPGRISPQLAQRVKRARQAPHLGFVFAEGFIFRADTHDAEAKTVLGHALAPGRGMEDGEEVLDLLAAHPSTARHIARKLAVRFVSDDPPASLVDRLASVFLRTQGDVPSVLRSLAYSPEFWQREVLGAKIKTPFELAASALRALDVEVRDARNTVRWVSRMGQPLYAHPAPTGFPETAEAWVNAGALLHRMNFGLELVTGRIAGLHLDIDGLGDGLEPESRLDALAIYLDRLLPGRTHQAALLRLGPSVTDPALAERLAAASQEASPTWRASPGNGAYPLDDAMEDSMMMGSAIDALDPSGGLPDDPDLVERTWGAPRSEAGPDRLPPSALEQVVGVILGSPEFQRR